jgi:2-polyprenyl-6-methoxyphenol hydroxylase-like FAD-dependent oxidoreductase
VGDVEWSSRFRVHHRLAERYRAGRVLLAGDAAHVHSPAGGQGMNLGIQDAHALGVAITRGDLDAYEAQRRPVAEHVVRLTDRMTRVATTSNPAARAVRDVLLPLAGRLPGVTTRVATDLAGLDQPRG